MKISDMYQIRNKTKSFGMKDYRVPKTNLYLDKQFHISQSQKPQLFVKKLKEVTPDPTKYSLTNEESVKKYWMNNRGKISMKERTTFVDILIKEQSSSPGPGYYKKNGHSDSSQKGKFSNSKTTSYLDEITYIAKEKPAPSEYSPNYSYVLPRIQETRIIKKQAKPGRQLSKIGPGELWDGIQAAGKHVMKRSQSVKISTCKHVNPIFNESITKKNVPPVGTYNHTDAYNKFMLKNGRLATMYSYKYNRFITDVMKAAKNVPGPGEYNIGPPGEMPVRNVLSKSKN